MSNYKHYETVGELIDILSQIPRETFIVTDNNNMEQRGYSKGGIINISIKNYTISKRDTYDAFDGTPYSYDCIMDTREGETVSFTGISL